MSTYTQEVRKLGPEQEKALGRAIIESEQEARVLLERLPLELELGALRKERTRAGAVDRLEHAVDRAVQASRQDPSLRPAVEEARAAWERSSALRWKLAMSGRSIVRAEARKIRGTLLDHEDLVQEGHIGLLRAAKRFDPDRGLRFATYARWWVRAQMTRAVDAGGRLVRLTGLAVEQTRNLQKAIKAYEADGAPWELADVAAEVGVSEERARLLLSQGHVTSLSTPLGEEPDSRTFEEILPDEAAPQSEQEIARAQDLGKLHQGLELLSDERDRFILTRRFGLEDDVHRTLSDIGAEMGLSRERVRQLEKRALRRLREAAELTTAEEELVEAA